MTCWGHFHEPSPRGYAVISNIKQQTKDLAAELKRVDWPSKQKVLSSTWAVLIVSALSGGFLYAADWLISMAMRLILPH